MRTRNAPHLPPSLQRALHQAGAQLMDQIVTRSREVSHSCWTAPEPRHLHTLLAAVYDTAQLVDALGAVGRPAQRPADEGDWAPDARPGLDSRQPDSCLVAVALWCCTAALLVLPGSSEGIGGYWHAAGASAREALVGLTGPKAPLAGPTPDLIARIRAFVTAIAARASVDDSWTAECSLPRRQKLKAAPAALASGTRPSSPGLPSRLEAAKVLESAFKTEIYQIQADRLLRQQHPEQWQEAMAAQSVEDPPGRDPLLGRGPRPQVPLNDVPPESDTDIVIVDN